MLIKLSYSVQVIVKSTRRYANFSQQNLYGQEFTSLFRYRATGLVPKIKGVCGNFYAVEKVC